jgi:hypothetical protein
MFGHIIIDPVIIRLVKRSENKSNRIFSYV